jgi:acetoin utilization protein AcuC
MASFKGDFKGDSGADSTAAGPLLVYGPRSVTYDFGPSHPLSPRRFGPGIDLLRAVGAEPGLAPEPASDEELAWLHSGDFLAAVKRFSADPDGPSEAGIGSGDDPAFAGMHEAAAAVAGGSIRAMEAILRGDVQHAYHPGGGLHHAMRSRASGFCIYNDVALAIARARRAGLRVMYVDLDVHHGDGVQALHGLDPGVLTISFHESGRSLFPGTGFVDEMGEGSAAGTAVNVPFEPMCGPDAWVDAVENLVPVLAAAFGPDVIVSQHGADGHFWDPLAHLSLTTTAMAEAARLVDRVAHRYAGGKWLATGGGGYAIYRVVPRAWALTWLAAAHREAPRLLPEEWRERWSGEAARWGDEPLPLGFEDGPNLRLDLAVNAAGWAGAPAAEKAARTVRLVRTLTVPVLLRVAEERGWWKADGSAASPDRVGADASMAAPAPADGRETAKVVGPLTLEMLDRLRLRPRTIAPTDTGQGMAILRRALAEGGVATSAVSGEWLVGVALAVPTTFEGVDELAAMGVAPEWRRRGLARAMMAALAEQEDRRGRAVVALHTVAERDPFDPLSREVRRSVAERLFRSAGFRTIASPPPLAAADAACFQAGRLPPGAASELAAAVERWSVRV